MRAKVWTDTTPGPERPHDAELIELVAVEIANDAWYYETFEDRAEALIDMIRRHDAKHTPRPTAADPGLR